MLIINIVIIGNIKTNGETIKRIASLMIEAGINVRYPAEEGLETREDSTILETFGRIDWCDFVVAVPREGVTFGYSTTYEMTYARHTKKPVLIYYE